MTKEEKIAELINIRDNFNYTLAPREVFDDAIKAIEEQKKLESGIKKVREQMLDSKFHGKTVLTYNDAINDCVKILDKLIESEG